jgi:hypothetical protein
MQIAHCTYNGWHEIIWEKLIIKKEICLISVDQKEGSSLECKTKMKDQNKEKDGKTTK